MMTWDGDSDSMKQQASSSKKFPIWPVLALLIALNVAFIGGLENEIIPPQQAALPALASFLPAEPSGPGHWHEISDIPLDAAKRLGPWSMTAHYEYPGGGAAVIHRVGEQYYRIFTIGGDVFYAIWYAPEPHE